MCSLNEFIKRHNIQAEFENCLLNPNMPDWKNANHYKVTLKYNGKKMTIYYSQGYGIKKAPSIKDVIKCLIVDNTEYYKSLSDWADEFGFNNNVREAERTYKACVNQTKKAKRLFGDIYSELMKYPVS